MRCIRLFHIPEVAQGSYFPSQSQAKNEVEYEQSASEIIGSVNWFQEEFLDTQMNHMLCLLCDIVVCFSFPFE